jgi:hypothetical protein
VPKPISLPRIFTWYQSHRSKPLRSSTREPRSCKERRSHTRKPSHVRETPHALEPRFSRHLCQLESSFKGPWHLTQGPRRQEGDPASCFPYASRALHRAYK